MRKSGTGILPVDGGEEHGQDAHVTRGSGTGDPPVRGGHGQDAHATLQIRQGAYLPHWTSEGATYTVTFRLGDSLPRSVLEAWIAERQNIVRTAEQMGRPLSEHEIQRLHDLHSERVEAYLDAGHGVCWLRRQEIAQLVVDALRFFDGQRYRMHAWCIMPNHVHTIFEPIPGHALPSILHSLKSFTAKVANRVLGKTGEFWQEEYYDHLIREGKDYMHAMRYLLDNPIKAGLENWPWVWSCGCGTGILPVEGGK